MMKKRLDKLHLYFINSILKTVQMQSLRKKRFKTMYLSIINRADFLVSWNFKHIVNIERIKGYNAINIKNGYKQLEIRSPREFKNYEND